MFKESEESPYKSTNKKGYNLYVYLKFFNVKENHGIFTNKEDFVVRFPIIIILDPKDNKSERVIDFEEITFNPDHIQILNPKDLDKVSYIDYEYVKNNSNDFVF